MDRRNYVRSSTRRTKQVVEDDSDEFDDGVGDNDDGETAIISTVKNLWYRRIITSIISNTTINRYRNITVQKTILGWWSIRKSHCDETNQPAFFDIRTSARTKKQHPLRRGATNPSMRDIFLKIQNLEFFTYVYFYEIIISREVGEI